MDLTSEQRQADNICRQIGIDTINQYSHANLPLRDLEQALISKIEHASIRLRETGNSAIADAVEDTFREHGASHWLVEAPK